MLLLFFLYMNLCVTINLIFTKHRLYSIWYVIEAFVAQFLIIWCIFRLCWKLIPRYSWEDTFSNSSLLRLISIDTMFQYWKLFLISCWIFPFCWLIIIRYSHQGTCSNFSLLHVMFIHYMSFSGLPTSITLFFFTFIIIPILLRVSFYSITASCKLILWISYKDSDLYILF